MSKNKNYPIYKTTYIDDMRSLVEEAAKNFPDRTALSYKKDPNQKEVTRVSFPEWRDDVRHLGTALIANGFREKHIALVGENSYGWCIAFFAIMAIGAVVVPVDKDLTQEDIAGIINTTECEALFFGKGAEKKVAQIKSKLPQIKAFYAIGEKNSIEGSVSLSELLEKGKKRYAEGDNAYYDYKIDPNLLASIVYTSGTTGKGKGVMLSQNNIGQDMTCGMYNFAITRKTLHVLPPHHTFGSTVNYVGHLAQGSEVFISSGLRYVADEIREQQPTHLILVPAFVEVMYRKIWATAKATHKAGLLKFLIAISNALRKIGIDARNTLFASVKKAFGSKLELIICGGARLDEDIIRTFDALGVTMLNGYGITECAPLISANRNKYQKKGSVGTPIIGCRVKIANPDENGDGEICVKGPNVMMGYYKDHEATAAAFDSEGYFHTGDYGHLDEEGWIYITGRLKNLIILANGKNVYPEEIEACIEKVPGVNEVVVYEGKSTKFHQKAVITAEIYPNQEVLDRMGVDDAEAYFHSEIKKINDKMPAYKSVKFIKLRNTEFEKNTSRKIVRFAIDKSID